MVRYSVTMDDDLVKEIDKICGSLGKSRSEWLNELCITYLDGASDSCVQTLVSAAVPPASGQGPNMTNYEAAYANFSIDVPEQFNFGYDVIDRWAERDRNKLAMIWVDQQGVEKKYSFRDLKNLSNGAANILLKYGIKRGDRVMLMLPRIPEWWIFVIALIKLGAVFCPCPTMLTPKDIKYRIQAGKFRMIITNTENAEKIERIADACPLLETLFLADGERDGWASYPHELKYPAPVSRRTVSMPVAKKTRATDPMLIYFTSGTTGEPTRSGRMSR